MQDARISSGHLSTALPLELIVLVVDCGVRAKVKVFVKSLRLFVLYLQLITCLPIPTRLILPQG